MTGRTKRGAWRFVAGTGKHETFGSDPASAKLGAVTRALHWSVALLLPMAFILAWSFAALGPSEASAVLVTVHRSVGLAILVLMVVRASWRMAHRFPPHPDATPWWEVMLANTVQAALYASLVAMPILGWMGSSAEGDEVRFLGLVPLPDVLPYSQDVADRIFSLHGALGYTIVALVTLHVAGALRHHFVKRDGVLRQGHSKKALLCCGDGFEPVFGEGLADLGEGLGAVVDDGQHGVSERRHGAWAGAGSDGTVVLAQGHVAPPVQAVLDEPVIAPQGEQGVGVGLLGRQAGDGIGDLVADRAGFLAGPFDAADLGCAGPAEMGHALAADGELPGLDAAMALFDSLRAADEVRWRRAVMGRRRRPAQGFDQFRGEKRRQRRRRGRPSGSAGWL